MSTIEEAQRSIVEEFSGITEWEERYALIIDIGKKHPDIPDEYKTEQFRVKGCQSTVWLHAKLENGRIVYEATSDAMIVRGLVALLIRVFSGRTPDEILKAKPTFIDDIGLSQNLTQGRANGLASMIEQIKLYAMAFGQLSKIAAAKA